MFTLMGHVKSGSEVGKIVRIGVETFWLIVGMEECPFTQPSQQVSQIYEEGDWFSFLHNFMQEFHLSMVLPKPSYMNNKCVWDKALMSAVADGWSRADLRVFNRCRIFCQVLFISNMATGDGEKILPEVLQGAKLNSNLTWLQQQRPGKKVGKCGGRFFAAIF